MKIQFLNRQKDPSVYHGVKIPYAPAKRKAAQWRWYLILLIVASPLLYFILRMGMSLVFVTAQGYISLDKIELNSTSPGIVDSINVEIGQEISSDTVISILHDPDLSAQKRQVEAELAAMSEPQQSHFSAKKQLLNNRISLAHRILSFQNNNFQTMEFLFKQGAATQAELNTISKQRDNAQSDYDNAVYEQKAYEEESLGQEIKVDPLQKKERSLLEAQLKTINEQLSRLPQTTPYGGRVLDILASPGQSISSGSPIAVIGRSDKPYVVAYINPKYAKYARQGHMAQVTLPNGRKIGAKVRENSQLTQRLPAHLISPIGSRNMMILVNLELVAPLPSINWVDGLPVDVRFRF
jgi:multidrug resistance efflux pump